jgi:tetratricopeptide (TPR) repeat protein
MGHQVFISYSVQDHTVAASICSVLERERVECWIAPRNLPAGLSEEEATSHAMKSSRLMVLVISAKSGHSPMLLHDVTRAVSQGLPMVLVRVGPLTLSRPLAALVPNPQWLEATHPPSADQLEAVIQAVKSKLPEEEPREREPSADRQQADDEYIHERIEAARLYFQYGLADRAIDKLNGVLQLFPFHAASREELVRIYTETGRLRDAADQLSQLAAIYHGLGERDRAREFEQKAKALAPAAAVADGVGDATVNVSVGSDPARTRALDDAATDPHPSGPLPGDSLAGVHFSVTAPPAVTPGSAFALDLWAHREAHRQQVLEKARQSAGGGLLRRTKPSPGAAEGAMLARLAIEGLLVEPREETFLWENDIGKAPFRVRVPEDSSAEPRGGLATIHFGGKTVARLHFELQVHASGAPQAVAFIPVREDRHR